MIQNIDTRADSTQQTFLTRTGWLLLILAALYVGYFSYLGAIGFVGPDEPRYAWIARDMAESGDWITPRLYGHPWFEKPVLYYWGAALSMRLLGVSEVSARLPSAISALLATLALALLARRIYGSETARWLLLILPTSAAMIGFSRAAATDMPFSGMLTIAMVAAAFILEIDSPALPASSAQTSFSHLVSRAAFGLFLGLAILAKGPAAIILAGGSCFIWAVAAGRWRTVFRLLHPAALLAFFLTALPWYVFCAIRNPDFLRVFIIEQNFRRYLTPEFRHIQPFWYYVPVLAACLFPWTAGAIGAAWNDLRERGWEKLRASPSLFLWCWAPFPVLFFSLSKSKLPGYILPAIPPFALLISHYYSFSAHGEGRASRLSLAVTGVLSVCAGITFWEFAPKIPSWTDVLPPTGWEEIIILLLILGGIVTAGLAILRKSRAALISCVVTTILVTTELGVALGGDLEWNYSARLASRQLLALRTPIGAENLAVYGLSRGLHYGLNYYLRRELPEWSPQTRPAGRVLTDYRGAVELEKLGFTCKITSVVNSAIIPCWTEGKSGTHPSR